MYTITYIFGETTSVGFLVGKDRFLTTIIFEVEAEGSNVSYLASNKGLIIQNHGRTKIEYNFDDFWLAPNEYEFTIIDNDKEFDNLFYEGALAPYVRKEFFIKKQIRYNDTGSYYEDYAGYAIAETIDYNEQMKTFSFTAYPKTQSINEAYLYDANGTANNPLNLNYSLSGKAIVWDWVKITDLITKIFQYINPSISIDIKQDWKFFGNTFSQIYGYPTPGYTSLELTFSDLIATWIGAVFGGNVYGNIKTLGDLIKELALSFGCMAGMVTQNKGFFKNIYSFDASNLQTLGKLLDDSPKKKFKFSKIDYARFETSIYKQDLGQEKRYVKIGYSASQETYQIPVGYAPNLLFNKVNGENGLDKTVLCCMEQRYNLLAGYDYLSNIAALYSGSVFYWVYGVEIPNLIIQDSYYSFNPPNAGGRHFNAHCFSLAELNYAMKGSLYKTPVYEFLVDGLNYDFLKGFVYNGNNFSIISLEKDYDLGITNIEAIKIVSQTLAGSTENNSGETIEDNFTFDALFNIAGSSNFSIVNINAGATAITTINEDEILEEIIIVTSQAFQSGKITGFTITDSGGELMTLNDVMGKFTSINKQTKTIFKKYTSFDTISFTFTGSSSLTGAGYIIVKKLRKEV